MLLSHSGPRMWNHPRTVLTSPYFGFKTQIHKMARGHRRDHLGQVQHRSERSLTVYGQVEEQSVPKSRQQAERDHDHYQPQRVPECLAELRVVQ